jgi:hypothetical protein
VIARSASSGRYRVRACLVSSLLLASLISVGCGSNSPVVVLDCGAVAAGKMATYDKYSTQFLDLATKHPTTNSGGQVVWGTRYYLESLITAYEATQDAKYLTSFADTGSSVMSLVQTLHLPNVIDPSAPGPVKNVPHIDETGWPTYMQTFGATVSIPTSSGRIALYVQSLFPVYTPAAYFALVTSEPDGSLQFAWSQGDQVLLAYTVHSVADLYSIASEPVVFGQSYGRINPTGLGLPMPGAYALNKPLYTLWHAEQTGGILLPFARFLMIAQTHPDLVDSSLAAAWKSKVLQIASGYVDHFASDGKGGYTLHNPEWMAHPAADTDAPSDYVWAEVSLRILLYELTGDTSHLSLARGLLHNQFDQDIPITSQQWLAIREWPNIYSWSSRSTAPKGNIYDSFNYDPTTPEDSVEGGFFAEMLHLAQTYNLAAQLGIPSSVIADQTNTFHNYIKIANAAALGFPSMLRSAYPTLHSSASDAVIPHADPLASAEYLDPETSDQSDWSDNWQWMQIHGTSPRGEPIGFYLRAWARSEAAMLQSCQSSTM